MRIFLEFLFGNEKMIIVSLIVILILFLFLVLVSFVKRDYIVTLRSYELFRERLDNLFLTQKNLYPFMFVLVVLSFIVFFLLLLLSLYFSLELYFSDDLSGKLIFILFIIGMSKSLLIYTVILCGSFVIAITLWNSILFQDFNIRLYWLNAVLFGFFLSIVVVFFIDSFPHAWAQGGDNLNSMDLSTQYKIIKSSDMVDQQLVSMCRSNPNIFLHNANIGESCVCSTEFTVFDNLADTFSPQDDRGISQSIGISSARSGFNNKTEYIVLAENSLELKLKYLFLQKK